MVRRLARLVALVHRALALTIVVAIAGGIVAELWARFRDAWILADEVQDVGRWMAAGALPPGTRGSGRPDWRAARRLADEAEYYALHPIDLTETLSARPAGPAE